MRINPIQLSAMVAALLLATGLVLRISATLTPVAPETRSDTAARQALTLRDGAFGVALFEQVQLAPGEFQDRCVTVSATGTRVPDEVRMLADSTVDDGLAPWLRFEITRGAEIGEGRQCEGYEPRTTVLAGGARSVMAALRDGVGWTPAPEERIPGGHAVTYRLRASLSPDTPNEVQGSGASFDLAWASDFDPTGETLLERALAVLIRFTEDSMIPMLAILALGILFLGIQDRLDVATPRLDDAALFNDVVRFEPLGDGGPEPDDD